MTGRSLSPRFADRSPRRHQRGERELARRTGLSRDEVISELAKMLPNVVDQMTPDGRLPTQREMERLLG